MGRTLAFALRGTLLALSLGLFAPAPSLAAVTAPPRLVADIHSGPPAAGLDAPLELVSLGSRTVFTASDPDHGRELWVSDGTPEGSGLLIDLCPGPCDANVIPWHVTEGGVFFFLRGVSPDRIDIWRTDGTTAGTLRLASFSFADVLGELPDQGLLVWVGVSASPDRTSRFWVSDGTAEGTRPFLDVGRFSSVQTPGTRLGDRLLFVLDTPELGDEPWVTDGTAAGTRLVADVRPGESGSLARGFVPLDGVALFVAGEPVGGHEPWVTDGTAAGTHRVVDLTPGPASTDLLGEPAGDGHRAYFVAQSALGGNPQLWVSDGTTAGTRQLTAFDHAQAFGDPRFLDASRLQVVDGRLYFGADDGLSGDEPWVSDGTPVGTHRLADVCPGPCSSFQGLPLEHPTGAALFRADDGATGSNLWTTDGTAAGTRRLGDFCPGPCSGAPHGVTSRGADAFFAAQASFQGPFQLWITDAAPAGTRRLTTFGSADAGLQSVANAWALAGDTLLFTAHTSQHGIQVWRSDGTRAGTAPLADLGARSSGGSSPEELLISGGLAFFFADDGRVGRELWTSDGTAAGTALVREVISEEDFPGAPRLRELTAVAGRVVFLADPAPPGAETSWELWTSDGTAAGTGPLDLGGAPVFDRDFGRLGGAIVFFAEGLWTSDGTQGGTRRIADLHAPAPAFRQFQGPFFATLGARLLFVGADGPGLPPVLWSTDGTPGGTHPVLGPPAVFVPQQLVAAGDRVVFVARDPEHGLEPWVSDGTPAGTRRLADLYSGDGNSSPRNLVAAGSRVFFTAETLTQGRELWVTDTTVEGTRMVRDLSPGGQSSAIEDLTAFGGRVAFTAAGTGRGRELWISDGTAGGTAQLLDLWPGPAGSDPRELTVIGGRLFFSAGTPERGRELWLTDGTAAGTAPQPDIAPGSGSSSPSGMTAFGGSILFAASDGARGRELWALDAAAGPGDDPPPPAGAWLSSPRIPGFRFQVRIVSGGGAAAAGAQEPACIPETACVSGAVPGRSEVFLRVVGPKPNGKLWPTLVKFTTSQVEVWIEQLGTGLVRYYRLEGARPGFDELPGLFDRGGFDP